jgi:entericidin A
MSSGHRPPAALLSNIGPVRIPSPPSKRSGPFCIPQKEVRDMTSFRAIILALMASFLVAGCNTVKGAGRDIESVGKAGEDAIK